MTSNYASNQSNTKAPEPFEEITIRQSEPPEKPESDAHEPTSKESQQPSGHEVQPESQEARYSATSKVSNRKSVRIEEPKDSSSPNRNLSPIINYFEENLQKGNESLRKLGEKKKELMRRVESLSLPKTDSYKIINTPTPGKSPSKKLDDTFLSKSASQNTVQKPSANERYSSVRLSLPDTKTEEVTSKSRRLPIEGEFTRDIIIQEQIEENEKEAREYRVRANKLVADHEKYVRRFFFYFFNCSSLKGLRKLRKKLNSRLIDKKNLMV